MTIRHFKIFAAAARTESITKAARQLYLTQPTVSVAVKEMETHYGTRFFERINQRLKITDDGRRMLSYALHLLSIYEDIEKSFEGPEKSGAVRVGASVSIGACDMPRLVQLFKCQYPSAKIRVIVEPSNKLEQRLLANEIDVALAGGALNSEFLISRPLTCGSYAAVCAPDYPISDEESLTIESLSKEPLLIREENSRASRLLMEKFKAMGLEVKPAWESSSVEALLQAAAYRLGVAVVPQKAAQPYIEDGRLRKLNMSDLDFMHRINLVYHKNKYMSELLKAFIQIVDKNFQL